MRTYAFSLLLLFTVLCGGVFGYAGGDYVAYCKPIGTIFLNLILTAVIPLVFFSVASAMTKLDAKTSLCSTLFKYMALFIVLGCIAACYMLVLVLIFKVAPTMDLPHSAAMRPPEIHFFDQLPHLVSVAHFPELFTSDHLLALIVFSMLLGVATKQSGDNAYFAQFLQAGEQVCIRLFTLIMTLAPLGFFAYFATMVHDIGPKIVTGYLRVTVIYYVGSLVYFLGIFSGVVYGFGGRQALRLFWGNVFLPAVTAIATCSSAACISVNCEALKKMRVPDAIVETLIPMGTLLHKQGSIMGGMVKIAFLFGLYHFDFAGVPVLLTAVGMSLLVGTVMGAIPSGGMLGELLILNVYGFPQETLFLIATISLIIDPPATLLNVTGNTVAGVAIRKFMVY